MDTKFENKIFSRHEFREASSPTVSQHLEEIHPVIIIPQWGKEALCYVFRQEVVKVDEKAEYSPKLFSYVGISRVESQKLFKGSPTLTKDANPVRQLCEQQQCSNEHSIYLSLPQVNFGKIKQKLLTYTIHQEEFTSKDFEALFPFTKEDIPKQTYPLKGKRSSNMGMLYPTTVLFNMANTGAAWVLWMDESTEYVGWGQLPLYELGKLKPMPEYKALSKIMNNKYPAVNPLVGSNSSDLKNLKKDLKRTLFSETVLKL